jgi:hypothetical protein
MSFPDKVISYPFGEMDVQSKDYAASVELAISNQKTLVIVALLTGAVTLVATPSTDLKKGAELIVKLQSDGTARAATLSTGFTGTSIAGTISKSKYAYFLYDGTNFVHLSTNQVD